MKHLVLKLPAHYGLFALRLVVGSCMIYNHGYGKILKFASFKEIIFLNLFNLGPSTSLFLAVCTEILCSILIIIGLYTRMALIPLFTTMLAAIFLVHSNDSLRQQEKAILYGVSYIALFLTGPGKLSIDAYLKKTSFNSIPKNENIN